MQEEDGVGKMLKSTSKKLLITGLEVRFLHGTQLDVNKLRILLRTILFKFFEAFSAAFRRLTWVRAVRGGVSLVTESRGGRFRIAKLPDNQRL